MAAPLALLGQRFGRLLVVAQEASSIESGRSRSRWRCECDCGTVKTISGAALKTGRTKSCGCLRSENMAHQYRVLAEKRRKASGSAAGIGVKRAEDAIAEVFGGKKARPEPSSYPPRHDDRALADVFGLRPPPVAVGRVHRLQDDDREA